MAYENRSFVARRYDDVPKADAGILLPRHVTDRARSAVVRGGIRAGEGTALSVARL